MRKHAIRDTAQAGFGVLAATALAASCSGPSEEATDQNKAAVSLSITLTNEVGRLTSTGTGLRRTFYAYDARGRTTATQHAMAGASYVFTSTYGFPCAASGCSATVTAPNGPVVVSSTFPDNEKVTYTFDEGGLTQGTVTTPVGGVPQTIVSRILRNARGQVVQVDYGDLTTTTNHYNDSSDFRLNQIETFSTASPSTVWQLYQYAFDGNGNVTSVTDYCDEASQGPCTATVKPPYSSTYAYDSRDQLVQAVRNNNVEYNYAYDNIGNLTNMEGTAQTYFPSGLNKRLPHAIQSIGGVNYQYDDNGNTTGTTGGSPTFSISWNAENMPTSMTYGSTTTTKSFVGEAIWKKVSGGATTYYLPSMRVEDGGVYRKYFGTYAERDGTDTSSCSDQPAKGCLKFYHGDHLGSSTLVVEVENVHNTPAPTVIYRQDYTAYGKDIVPPSTFPFTPKEQFNFKEKDDISGFYDYGARVYDPTTGRWLSPDTVLTEARYAYANNNPLKYVDPTGHEDHPVDTASPTDTPYTIKVSVHDHGRAYEPGLVHRLADAFWQWATDANGIQHQYSPAYWAAVQRNTNAGTPYLKPVVTQRTHVEPQDVQTVLAMRQKYMFNWNGKAKADAVTREHYPDIPDAAYLIANTFAGKDPRSSQDMLSALMGALRKLNEKVDDYSFATGTYQPVSRDGVKRIWETVKQEERPGENGEVLEVEEEREAP
jgi:RHS repeat-associated protein